MQVLESSMEIDLCWHQQRTNNKWADDLTYHLMVYLEVIIALASMIYCRLRCSQVTSGGWKFVQWFYYWMLGLHNTFDRGSLLFKSIFVYISNWLYMNVIFFTYTYCHLYLYPWNLMCNGWFTKRKLVYKVFLENPQTHVVLDS